MGQTIIALCALLTATLWLPLWVQIVLYVVAIFFVRHRLLLFIPAVFADVYYANMNTFSFMTLKTTITVGMMLLIFWLLTTKTRMSEWYDLAKK